MDFMDVGNHTVFCPATAGLSMFVVARGRLKGGRLKGTGINLMAKIGVFSVHETF
jgi:hypothetical protein